MPEKNLLMALESSAAAWKNTYNHYKIPWENLNQDDQILNNLYVFLIVILNITALN